MIRKLFLSVQLIFSSCINNRLPSPSDEPCNSTQHTVARTDYLVPIAHDSVDTSNLQAPVKRSVGGHR